MADFFDLGHSHRLPWHARQRAAAPLRALADPHRQFDPTWLKLVRTLCGRAHRREGPVIVVQGSLAPMRSVPMAQS